MSFCAWWLVMLWGQMYVNMVQGQQDGPLNQKPLHFNQVYFRYRIILHKISTMTHVRQQDHSEKCSAILQNHIMYLNLSSTRAFRECRSLTRWLIIPILPGFVIWRVSMVISSPKYLINLFLISLQSYPENFIKIHS